MATHAQITANRRNAQKSTGPRSTQGKAIVSKNAQKHGLSTIQTVINSENQQDFDHYRERILDELNPQTPMESMLTERAVCLSWRLKRALTIQNQVIDALNARMNTPTPLEKLTQSLLPKTLAHLQPDSPESAPESALGRLIIKDFTNARVLERLLMYERRIENSLFKTILEIQKLNLIKKMELEHQITLSQLTP